MNSWEISSSFRCGFLWIASSIMNRSVLRLESTGARCLTTREIVGFQKQLFPKVCPQGTDRNKTNKDNMKRAVIFAPFPWNLPLPNTRKKKNRFFCLCCVIVSEGFDIPAVRDSLEHRSRSLLTTCYVIRHRWRVPHSGDLQLSVSFIRPWRYEVHSNSLHLSSLLQGYFDSWLLICLFVDLFPVLSQSESFSLFKMLFLASAPPKRALTVRWKPH